MTLYQLPKVGFLITGRCNRICPICYSPATKYMPEPSTDTVKKTLDILAEIGVKVPRITGGEPLIRKDIVEIAEYAASIGTPIYLMTNGDLLLTKYEGLANNLYKVSLSLDAPDNRSNIKNNPDQFDVVKRILEYFDINRPVHKVRINTVASMENSPEVIDIGKFLTERKSANKGHEAYMPDEWKLSQYCSWGPNNHGEQFLNLPLPIVFDCLLDVCGKLFGDKVNVRGDTDEDKNNRYILILPNLEIVVPTLEGYKPVGFLENKNSKYLESLINELFDKGLIKAASMARVEK